MPDGLSRPGRSARPGASRVSKKRLEATTAPSALLRERVGPHLDVHRAWFRAFAGFHQPGPATRVGQVGFATFSTRT